MQEYRKWDDTVEAPGSLEQAPGSTSADSSPKAGPHVLPRGTIATRRQLNPAEATSLKGALTL